MQVLRNVRLRHGPGRLDEGLFGALLAALRWTFQWVYDLLTLGNIVEFIAD